MTDDCIKKCSITDIEEDKCECGADHEKLTKTDDLKSALSALGYKVKEDKKGEIVISE